MGKSEHNRLSQRLFHDSLDHRRPDLGCLFEPRFEEVGGFAEPLLIQPEASVRDAATPSASCDDELQVVGTVGLIMDGGVNRIVKAGLRPEENLGDTNPHPE